MIPIIKEMFPNKRRSLMAFLRFLPHFYHIPDHQTGAQPERICRKMPPQTIPQFFSQNLSVIFDTAMNIV